MCRIIDTADCIFQLFCFQMKLEVETLKEQLQGSEDKCSQLQSEVKEVKIIQLFLSPL